MFFPIFINGDFDLIGDVDIFPLYKIEDTKFDTVFTTNWVSFMCFCFLSVLGSLVFSVYKIISIIYEVQISIIPEHMITMKNAFHLCIGIYVFFNICLYTFAYFSRKKQRKELEDK